MALSLANLLVQETKEAIYETGLRIANAIGLPVSTWQAGDPTRSQFHLEAEILAAVEAVAAGYVASGFLDSATGPWREILADQQFGVVVPAASSASTTVTLTNAGGGVYDLEAGDLTFRNATSGKTYRNTTGGHLGAGETLDVTVVADEAGSDSSAGAGEIDELVTALLGVTCSNAEAAIGTDAQDWDVTKQQCRDKIDTLSIVGGAKGAYSYVARNPDLTGTRGVTRVRVFSDSDVGDVVVYLAGPSGAVSSADRALVEDAILTYATPLCVTPSVLATTNVSVPITYQVWLYTSANRSAAEAEADILAALQALFASRPIGGDIIPPATTGALYKSMIESTIRGVFPQAFRVTVSTPSGDTALGNGEVATLGAVTATINLVVDP